MIIIITIAIIAISNIDCHAYLSLFALGLQVTLNYRIFCLLNSMQLPPPPGTHSIPVEPPLTLEMTNERIISY